MFSCVVNEAHMEKTLVYLVIQFWMMAASKVGEGKGDFFSPTKNDVQSSLLGTMYYLVSAITPNTVY